MNDTKSSINIKKYNVDSVIQSSSFSHATICNNIIHVSGTLATEGNSINLPIGIKEQTLQVLRNIQLILAGANTVLENIVKMNNHVSFELNESNFALMNEAYKEFFGDITPPSRITIGGAKLIFNALIEIDCQA